jgi:hypothetical protein
VVDGRCLAWKNILDMRRAVDYLASRRHSSRGSRPSSATAPCRPMRASTARNCCTASPTSCPASIVTATRPTSPR